MGHSKLTFHSIISGLLSHPITSFAHSNAITAIIFIGYSDLHIEYNAMTIDVSTGSWKSVLLSSPFCLTFDNPYAVPS